MAIVTSVLSWVTGVVRPLKAQPGRNGEEIGVNSSPEGTWKRPVLIRVGVWLRPVLTAPVCKCAGDHRWSPGSPPRFAGGGRRGLRVQSPLYSAGVQQPWQVLGCHGACVCVCVCGSGGPSARGWAQWLGAAWS